MTRYCLVLAILLVLMFVMSTVAVLVITDAFAEEKTKHELEGVGKRQGSTEKVDAFTGKAIQNGKVIVFAALLINEIPEEDKTYICTAVIVQTNGSWDQIRFFGYKCKIEGGVYDVRYEGLSEDAKKWITIRLLDKEGKVLWEVTKIIKVKE